MKEILLLSKHFIYRQSVSNLNDPFINIPSNRLTAFSRVIIKLFLEETLGEKKREAMHQQKFLALCTVLSSKLSKTSHIFLSQTNAFDTFYNNFFHIFSLAKRLLSFSDCCFIDLLK